MRYKAIYWDRNRMKQTLWGSCNRLLLCIDVFFASLFTYTAYCESVRFRWWSFSLTVVDLQSQERIFFFLLTLVKSRNSSFSSSCFSPSCLVTRTLPRPSLFTTSAQSLLPLLFLTFSLYSYVFLFSSILMLLFFYFSFLPFSSSSSSQLLQSQY